MLHRDRGIILDLAQEAGCQGPNHRVDRALLNREAHDVEATEHDEVDRLEVRGLEPVVRPPPRVAEGAAPVCRGHLNLGTRPRYPGVELERTRPDGGLLVRAGAGSEGEVNRSVERVGDVVRLTVRQDGCNRVDLRRAVDVTLPDVYRNNRRDERVEEEQGVGARRWYARHALWDEMEDDAVR